MLCSLLGIVRDRVNLDEMTEYQDQDSTLIVENRQEVSGLTLIVLASWRLSFRSPSRTKLSAVATT
jgi:hypothetical protein